jgi:hypothetical protein
MKTLFLSLLLALGLQAAPLLTLDQADLLARPGQTLSWQFRMEPDGLTWATVTSSQLLLETNPGLGIYTDMIGLLGGPAGRLAPSDPPWTGAVGYYDVDPAAAIGDRNEALLWITYELFSDDPSTCDGCLVFSGLREFAVSVEVVPEPSSEVPEPGTWTLVVPGLALVAWRLRPAR